MQLKRYKQYKWFRYVFNLDECSRFQNEYELGKTHTKKTVHDTRMIYELNKLEQIVSRKKYILHKTSNFECPEGLIKMIALIDSLNILLTLYF